MRWTLIVSSDEQFQRVAISSLRAARSVVGATGEGSAFGMVRGIDVERVVVDAVDEVGRRFLGALRTLPSTACADLDIIAVGTYPGDRFTVAPDLEQALAQLSLLAA